ncbi:MAG: class I SAM-dependent methyltransferase [Bacteriovoracaceae bacterium]
MKTIDKSYWEKNYSEPETMDGIGNSREHAQYLKAFLALEHEHITTMVDFGCGYGHLFKTMIKTFIPHYAVGIEPSEFAFKKAKRLKLKPVESSEVYLYQKNLLDWCLSKKREPVFDLGICTSVFQYIPDKDLKLILPILAKKVKLLYLTVPTNEEFKRQGKELNFVDEYAIHRTRERYQTLMKPHFTCISARIFESKVHYNEKNTAFSDLLFRY